jgi:hypothetical protein
MISEFMANDSNESTTIGLISQAARDLNWMIRLVVSSPTSDNPTTQQVTISFLTPAGDNATITKSKDEWVSLSRSTDLAAKLRELLHASV